MVSFHQLNKQMKFSIMILAFTATAIGMLISSGDIAAEKNDTEMSVYLWKNRPLLLFAQSPSSPGYPSVQEILSAHINQIIDRHMVIIEVFENGLVRVDGKSNSQYSAESLRQHFSAKEGKLTTILVGKDGGIKFRQIGKFHLGDIFSLIDEMPMRQQEMRNSFE